MKDPAPELLRTRLLGWYRRSKRRLPWRASSDPYRIWVSEVMLQQTTVKTVTPYYERFVERFPSLASLAAARDEDVLALWSGLGYYHRARNLVRGARVIAEKHAGVFPKTLEAALAVPGVGLYTASAILSIGYGEPLPVVDGNVRRVLARLFALRGAAYRKDGPFYNLAEGLLDREAPGDFNQALMELGATLCIPKAPLCPACPLRAGCRAREEGSQESLPEKTASRAPVQVTVAAALIRERGRTLLVRRPEGRLMGRLWELPQTSLESQGLPDLERELRERHGLLVKLGGLVATGRHAITFRRIRLEGYAATLKARPALDPDRLRFVSVAELPSLPMSSLTKKLLRGDARSQLPLALD